MNGLPYYKAYPALRRFVEDDGWFTPNTYGKEFRPIEAAPAVYLFMMTEDLTFERGLIAYVGMSANLKQRLAGHPVLAEIDKEGRWVTPWFKPTGKRDLSRVERKYIDRFDPPWNIQGRKRGIPEQ